MMKVVVLLYIYIFSCGILNSQNREKGWYLETGTNFNTSNFKWSIAGNLGGYSPNILSELKFNRITSLGFYIKSNYSPLKHLKFSTYYQQNYVINGNGIDTDYKDDNRTSPTFEKSFISNKGDLMVLKSGIGIPIFLSTKISITPFLFYYLTTQEFYLLSHETQDLESTYKTNIQGAKISIKGNIQVNKIIYSSLTLSYRFVNYEAEANWNLIEIFKHPLSFTHTSKGFGLDLDMMFGYNINKMFSVVVGGSLNTTTIRKGIDTSYLVTGKEIFTQFNGAKSFLSSIKLGFCITL